MKTKFTPRPRTRATATPRTDAEAEKKVARFMTRFFSLALAVIVVFVVYLWWIGKFA